MSPFFIFWLLLAAIPDCDVGEWIGKLSDTKAAVRNRAATEIESQRRRCENELLRQVKDVLAKGDDEFNGRTHTVLQAVAALRADKAVPELVRAADFTLDPETMPIGGFNAAEEHYPAAQALRSIGDRAVIREIVFAAKKPQSDDVVRIYAWVLNEVLGKAGARVVVEQAKIDAVLEQQERLSRLLKLVDEVRCLQMPRRKPKRNPPAPNAKKQPQNSV